MPPSNLIDPVDNETSKHEVLKVIRIVGTLARFDVIINALTKVERCRSKKHQDSQVGNAKAVVLLVVKQGAKRRKNQARQRNHQVVNDKPVLD